MPTNLPLQLTSFVGRRSELAEVKRMLSENRLVTVTGPGGTGKTRLALEVARQVSHDFSDGAFFVDLSAISDAALVVPTIAAALGVREEGWERPVHETLEERLRYQRLLLVLDNYEQVLGAADVVPQLLTTAPGLRIIVTSRAPLRVRGEHVITLTPLRVPDTGSSRSPAELSQVEAVALFVQRAVAVMPHFTLDEQRASEVADIVARLDGLPLAIELAASRVAFMSPRAMLGRLEHRLALLTTGPRDAPARQQTLRATIGWSYELLAESERALFRRLAVFSGGSTVEASTRVCADDGAAPDDVLDGLTILAENSLAVTRDPGDGGMRFGMLQTVREFGLECLEREDDAPSIRRRHAEWFLQLAEAAEVNLRGPQIEMWLATLQFEHENVRAALGWAIGSNEGDIAMRLVAAMWRFWHLAGLLSEGRRWADTALALPSAGDRTMARARALAAAGSLAYWQNDESSVRRAYGEALSIGRELGDERAIAEGTYNLAFAHGLAPTHAGSHELFLESQRRFESVDHQVGAANSLWALAMMARLSGDFEAARARADKSVQLLRELGDLFGLIDALGELGRAALELGDYEVARRSFLETLDPLEPIGYRTAIAITLDYLAELENRIGHPVRALRLGGAAEALKEESGGQVPPEFAVLSDLRAAARTSLSQEAVAAAWEEGRNMSLQEALEFARAADG